MVRPIEFSSYAAAYMRGKRVKPHLRVLANISAVCMLAASALDWRHWSDLSRLQPVRLYGTQLGCVYCSAWDYHILHSASPALH